MTGMEKPMSDDAGLLIRKILVYGIIILIYAFVIVASTVSIIGIPIAIVALFTFIIQYFYADKIILRATGARILAPGEAPGLERIIGALSEKIGIEPPRIAFMNNPIPNAYAIGRKNVAIVAITSGLLDTLPERELECVLAHELVHVKKRDSFVVAFSSFIISMFSTVLYMLAYMLFSGAGSRLADAAAMAISLILSNTIGLVLVNAVSRYREYGADRGAALVTRDPDGLISALRIISYRTDTLHNRMVLDSAKGLTTIPLNKAVGELFSTHPLLENRIKELEKLKSTI